MPPQYIKDLVEYFYEYNKTEMHGISHVIFTITGLGRFIIRPLKFWSRKKKLKILVDDFASRRDNRGLMINREVEIRYQQMETIEPEVQKLYDYKKKQMYR